MDRWYSGSGIYRHVWLIVTEPLHVNVWDTYVTTPEVSENQALIQVQTEVVNADHTVAHCDVVTVILDLSGQVIAEQTSLLQLNASDRGWVEQRLLMGEGKIIAVDNGNLASDESFKGSSRTTYFGKCLAIVQSTEKTGMIVLKAHAEGLESATLRICVV